jgi:hypothetical protein
MALDPTHNSVQGDAQEIDPPGLSPAIIPPAQDIHGETTAQQPASQGAYIEADVSESKLLVLRTSDMTIVDRRYRFRTRKRL